MPESELDRGARQEQAFCVEFKGNDQVRWLEKWGPRPLIFQQGRLLCDGPWPADLAATRLRERSNKVGKLVVCPGIIPAPWMAV